MIMYFWNNHRQRAQVIVEDKMLDAKQDFLSKAQDTMSDYLLVKDYKDEPDAIQEFLDTLKAVCLLFHAWFLCIQLVIIL